MCYLLFANQMEAKVETHPQKPSCSWVVYVSIRSQFINKQPETEIVQTRYTYNILYKEDISKCVRMCVYTNSSIPLSRDLLDPSGAGGGEGGSKMAVERRRRRRRRRGEKKRHLAVWPVA